MLFFFILFFRQQEEQPTQIIIEEREIFPFFFSLFRVFIFIDVLLLRRGFDLLIAQPLVFGVQSFFLSIDSLLVAFVSLFGIMSTRFARGNRPSSWFFELSS